MTSPPPSSRPVDGEQSTISEEKRLAYAPGQALNDAMTPTERGTTTDGGSTGDDEEQQNDRKNGNKSNDNKDETSTVSGDAKRRLNCKRASDSNIQPPFTRFFSHQRHSKTRHQQQPNSSTGNNINKNSNNVGDLEIQQCQIQIGAIRVPGNVDLPTDADMPTSILGSSEPMPVIPSATLVEQVTAAVAIRDHQSPTSEANRQQQQKLAKKKRKMKFMYILIFILVIIIAGLTGGLWFAFGRRRPPPPPPPRFPPPRFPPPPFPPPPPTGDRNGNLRQP